MASTCWIGCIREAENVPEHPGAARIRKFLDDLALEGPEVVRDYFDAGVVWHVGRGHPENGTHRGVEGLVDYFRNHRMGSGEVDVRSAAVLADDNLGAVFIDVVVPDGEATIELLLPQVFRMGDDGSWDEYWILEPTRRAPGLPDTRPEIEASEAFNQYWYYSIELVPGLYTPGLKHLNLGLTRHLLAGCEVENRRCLDIGTMEAAVPVLLSRRKAKEVVAVDVMNCQQKVRMVKHYTGTWFNYHGGLTHARTEPLVRRRYGGNFDLVVLSGVLYHCFGPLHVLATARSLVRTGGLMIVETFTAVDRQQAMFFNARGALSPDASTYFLISVPLLEYLLRYFKLTPIDCVASHVVTIEGRKCARVAVTCRATNEHGPGSDPWMEAAAGEVDYRTLIDWSSIDSSGEDPPAYATPASRFVGPEGSCDVTRTVFDSPPLELPERVAMIGLEDLY
jgi:2-polyprenyl-3-methyl-5-hydroxy-6-metoxy-1,4-benzoquinol methylase